MDRPLVYPAQVPADTDMLTGWMATMRALSGVLTATLGTGTVFDGLAVTPGTGLTVSVGPGSIVSNVVADTASYGSLGTATDYLTKMGINSTSTTVPATGAFTAPTTSGQSVNILIQAQLSEADSNPVLLPYMNASNPSVPYGGPANNGVAQPTLRTQLVALSYVAGTPATTGTQTTPAATGSNVPIAVVTLAYGAASITTSNISLPANPVTVNERTGTGIMRGRLLGVCVFTTTGATRDLVTISGWSNGGAYVPAPGTTRVRGRLVGGGGQGGGAAATGGATISSGGGGAAGNYVEFEITSNIAGRSITIGAAGSGASAGSTGTAGGASYFGSVTANGGAGGTGGAAVSSGSSAGGLPGTLVTTGYELVNNKGQGGGTGWGIQPAPVLAGGGGSSPLGGGAPGGASASAPATGYGAGGAGAGNGTSGAAAAGLAGTAGMLILEEWS